MSNAPARPRLVLVEDDEDTLESASMVLGEKYLVFGYASALAALQAIDTVKPDVLMLDIGMHPIDGVECLKMIRAAPDHREIPAVAVTGFAGGEERRRFLESGFQAVIAKPILDLSELMATIDGLVGQRGITPRRAARTLTVEER